MILIQASLLKQCQSVLPPTITNIINLSLSTGVFPYQYYSKTVLYIHFWKNPTLTKNTYPTTGQFLTYLTYPNLQMTIWMKTTSWTLSSLPTPNSTLLKPLYLLYTTTLSEPWVNSKSLVCVFLIFLPPLTLLTIPFFYIDSNLGLISLTLSYPGFNLTIHFVLLLLISMASNRLPLNFSTVFLKGLLLFLVLFLFIRTLYNSTQFNNISIICQS